MCVSIMMFIFEKRLHFCGSGFLRGFLFFLFGFFFREREREMGGIWDTGIKGSKRQEKEKFLNT